MGHLKNPDFSRQKMHLFINSMRLKMYFYLGKFVGTHLEILIHVWRDTDMFGERLIHILIRKKVFCCLMIFFPLPEVETKRKEPLLKQKKGAVYIYIQSYRRGVCLCKKIALKAFFFLLLTNICSPEREAPRTRLEKAKKGSTMCSCYFFFYHHALKELFQIFC